MTVYDYYLTGYLTTTASYQDVSFNTTEERVAFALGAIRGRAERGIETKSEVEAAVAAHLTAPVIEKQ